MSYPGPPPSYGPPTVSMPPDSGQGRSGPPLWLGLVVLLLGPAVFAVALGWVVISALDLGGATAPVTNPTVLTAQGGSTHVVFSEASAKPCHILRDGGRKESLETIDATESLTVAGRIYVARGSFTAETTRAVRVECPESGPLLLVLGVQTENLGLKIALLAAGMLGSFVIGLLMVIFRRRRPRY